jgi:hypothetical protein
LQQKNAFIFVLLLLIATVANYFGIWYSIFFTSLITHIYFKKTKSIISINLLIGACSWIFPLFLTDTLAQNIQLAQLLGNMIGLGTIGAIIALLLPILISLVVAGCSTWMILSIQKLIFTISNKTNDGSNSKS